MIFKLSLSSVEKKHSAKSSLSSVVFLTLDKELFAECQKKHSAKSFFTECFSLPRVFCMALGKEILCRVPKKHSAKYLTLGKEPNSGSVGMDLNSTLYIRRGTID
jgi:hypothetical protein